MIFPFCGAPCLKKIVLMCVMNRGSLVAAGAAAASNLIMCITLIFCCCICDHLLMMPVIWHNNPHCDTFVTSPYPALHTQLLIFYYFSHKLYSLFTFNVLWPSIYFNILFPCTHFHFFSYTYLINIFITHASITTTTLLILSKIARRPTKIFTTQPLALTV